MITLQWLGELKLALLFSDALCSIRAGGVGLGWTPFVPTGSRIATRRMGQKRRSRERSHAQPLGEHGEYPPFDAAEHGDRSRRADSARRNVPG